MHLSHTCQNLLIGTHSDTPYVCLTHSYVCRTHVAHIAMCVAHIPMCVAHRIHVKSANASYVHLRYTQYDTCMYRHVRVDMHT